MMGRWWVSLVMAFSFLAVPLEACAVSLPVAQAGESSCCAAAEPCCVNCSAEDQEARLDHSAVLPSLARTQLRIAATSADSPDRLLKVCFSASGSNLSEKNSHVPPQEIYLRNQTFRI